MKLVKIYTKVPCSYCAAAKRLLDQKGVPYAEVELTDNFDEILRLKNQTGMRTFPMIFIGDELIGGYTEMKDLEASGELDRKLNP